MSTMMHRSMLALASFTLAACIDAAPVTAGDGAQVAITIAPLTLTGVVNATYDVAVRDLNDALVWERTLSADAFGDGVGSVSYVGPCDASASPNTVQVTVRSLSDATGLLPPTSWLVPPPLERAVPCVANADTAVTFDLTVARAATQGFFDVAVTFNDLFCSAKLDCGPTTAAADDLLLLHDTTGTRRTTAVLGFACTGGPETDVDTRLYLDDLVITCVKPPTTTTTVVSLTSPGNVDFVVPPNANPAGYLFAATVYQGSEALAHKVYWTVALGLDRQAFDAAGTCTLTTAGTASNGPLAGNAIAANVVYPFVAWDVALSDASGRLCTRHEVDGTPSGVATGYSDGEALTFDHGVSWPGAPSTPPVSTAPVFFDATDAAQPFTVPSGCITLLTTAWGAGGGAGGHGDVTGDAVGGAGGFTEAVVPVTPGETLTVIVGGGGARGVVNGAAVGGYGGGATTHGSGTWAGGGAGGGLSGLFRGSYTQTSALVVAGGGGGGISENGPTGHGGAGGGADGADAGQQGIYAQRGGGATPAAAGAGGADGGSPGAALAGGAPHPDYIGGGGGGGYFGGGGGGWTARQGGGGGGGAGFVVSAATHVTQLRGAGRTPPREASPYRSAATGFGAALGAARGGDGRVILRCNTTPAVTSSVCPNGSVVLTATGGPQGVEVPAGCTGLAIAAWGAGGGSGGEPGFTDSSGGAGGYAAGTVAVAPGEVLLVWVGGGGAAGVEDGGAKSSFGGGGPAYGSGGWAGGGAGGGLSGVFRGAPTATAALVLAGGGGGGISANGSDAPGGAGGGSAGANGAERAVGQGGRGGTQLAAGVGGANGGYSGSAVGGGGVAYWTGAGASFQAWIGGGGGGGYFGGGGGGWTAGMGGGGGGGSGHVAGVVSAATNVAGSGVTPPHTADPGYVAGAGVGGAANAADLGHRGGDGLVILTWQP